MTVATEGCTKPRLTLSSRNTSAVSSVTSCSSRWCLRHSSERYFRPPSCQAHFALEAFICTRGWPGMLPEVQCLAILHTLLDTPSCRPGKRIDLLQAGVLRLLASCTLQPSSCCRAGWCTSSHACS